ncbi:MAG: CidA/LrgA family protein [Christensenellales bacterium]
MKVLKSIALLFFLCWVGDIVSAYLPFPIPGSIISMALLFILLLTGVIKQHHVQPTGDYLLENMGILFLPSLVAVMAIWPLLRTHFSRFFHRHFRHDCHLFRYRTQLKGLFCFAGQTEGQP